MEIQEELKMAMLIYTIVFAICTTLSYKFFSFKVGEYLYKKSKRKKYSKYGMAFYKADKRDKKANYNVAY